MSFIKTGNAIVDMEAIVSITIQRATEIHQSTHITGITISGGVFTFATGGDLEELYKALCDLRISSTDPFNKRCYRIISNQKLKKI